MLLPTGLTLSMMQTKWKAVLDVLLGNPSLNSTILSNVSLTSGLNTINHGLGRALQGWRVVRQTASASLYDVQNNNPHPNLTLMLMSSEPVVVNLEVF